MFPFCAPVTRGLYSVAACIGLYSAQTVFAYKQLQRVILLATHLSSPDSPSPLSLTHTHTFAYIHTLHAHTNITHTNTQHTYTYIFLYTQSYIHSTHTYIPHTQSTHTHLNTHHTHKHTCAHTHGKPLFEIFGSSNQAIHRCGSKPVRNSIKLD